MIRLQNTQYTTQLVCMGLEELVSHKYESDVFNNQFGPTTSWHVAPMHTN